MTIPRADLFVPRPPVEVFNARLKFEAAKLIAVTAPFTILGLPYTAPPPELLRGGQPTTRRALGLERPADPETKSVAQSGMKGQVHE